MNSQYKKAVEWVKNFKVSSIKSVDVLLCMNMSQLRVLAAKINKEMGQVITKSKFGKTWSRMSKSELIDAIWFVRETVMASPKGSYSLLKLSQRISCQMCDGVQHVVYFGFMDEKEATRFYYYLNQQNGMSILSALRPANRMNKFKWEVKVWGMNGDLLAILVNRDKKAENQQKYIEAEIEEMAKAELSFSEKLERHSAQRMYDNMKHKENSHKAIISFLKNRGFEIVNGVVDYAF